LSYRKTAKYKHQYENRTEWIEITRVDATNGVKILVDDGFDAASIEIPYNDFIEMIIKTGLERA
jgi:hypothetical protein